MMVLTFMGSLLAARTCAAAERALNFLAAGAAAALALPPLAALAGCFAVGLGAACLLALGAGAFFGLVAFGGRGLPTGPTTTASSATGATGAVTSPEAASCAWLCSSTALP
jgi:hypothetical protein